MKLITMTGELSGRFGMEKAIGLIADAGFDGLDLTLTAMPSGNTPFNGDDGVEYAKKCKEWAQQRGISFVQAHAPCDYRHLATDSETEQMTELIKRSIQIAAAAGCEIIVVHPLQQMDYTKNFDRLFEMNMEYYRMLAQVGEKYGIKIAAENMFQGEKHTNRPKDSTCANPKEFCEYIDSINSPWLVACLDIGHCAVSLREPQDVIEYMTGQRIKCLHVHDNDYMTDLHTLPLTASIDFEGVMKALAYSGYTGNLTYECDKFSARYKEEMVPAALRFMHDTGRYLISRYNEYKKDIV